MSGEMMEWDTARELADLRKAAHLTQAELGRRIGVVRQTVAKWEHGESEPTISQWWDIIAATKSDAA